MVAVRETITTSSPKEYARTSAKKEVSLGGPSKILTRAVLGGVGVGWPALLRPDVTDLIRSSGGGGADGPETVALWKLKKAWGS